MEEVQHGDLGEMKSGIRPSNSLLHGNAGLVDHNARDDIMLHSKRHDPEE
jgi:hypothetical protein